MSPEIWLGSIHTLWLSSHCTNIITTVSVIFGLNGLSCTTLCTRSSVADCFLHLPSSIRKPSRSLIRKNSPVTSQVNCCDRRARHNAVLLKKKKKEVEAFSLRPFALVTPISTQAPHCIPLQGIYCDMISSGSRKVVLMCDMFQRRQSQLHTKT
jgi:hypothetical protein